MAIDLSNLECMQAKPFDIRRERREFRRYCKMYGILEKKKILHCFRTRRRHFQWVTEGFDGNPL